MLFAFNQFQSDLVGELLATRPIFANTAFAARKKDFYSTFL